MTTLWTWTVKCCCWKIVAHCCQPQTTTTNCEAIRSKQPTDRFSITNTTHRFSKMVKLTPELINQSMQFINPCRDRELDLRGVQTFIILRLTLRFDREMFSRLQNPPDREHGRHTRPVRHHRLLRQRSAQVGRVSVFGSTEMFIAKQQQDCVRSSMPASFSLLIPPIIAGG